MTPRAIELIAYLPLISMPFGAMMARGAIRPVPSRTSRFICSFGMLVVRDIRPRGVDKVREHAERPRVAREARALASMSGESRHVNAD
jgi:hypothetical protein